MESNGHKRIRNLTAELNQYRKEYYEDNSPSVADEVYDKLFDELKNLEESEGFSLPDSPTKTVGYSVKSLKKTEHTVPLLSLDKTKSIEDIHNRMLYNDLMVMYKLDGLTVKLTYEKGKLKEAATRGNGFVGEVITHNARKFINVPHTIPSVRRVVISGEAIVMRDTFNRINNELPEEERFKTPRNYAAGSVRQLDSKICSQRKISFFAFSPIEGFPGCKTLDETFQKMEQFGFSVVPHILLKDNVQKTPVALKRYAEELREEAEEKNFPIDGIVYRYNDMQYGDSLGRTSHHFNYALAYKFEDEFAITTLRDIEWTIGRTGILTPTAVFDPVELDGTTVSRASLHNLSIINKLKLNVGDTIKVVKANMIIPQVTENFTKSGGYSIKSFCPECGNVLTRTDTDDTIQIRCDNPKCPGRFIEKLVYFCSKQAMDIQGLSRQTIKKLIIADFLKSPADVYKLPTLHLPRLASSGIGVKTFENICKSIEKSRVTTLEKYIVSLGIPDVGMTAAKVISDFEKGDYNSFMKHVVCGYNFSNLAGIGTVVGNNITTYFNDANNKEEATALAGCLEFKNLIPIVYTDVDTFFTKKIMCVSGRFKDVKKEQVKKELDAAGAVVVDGMNAQVNYLVCDEGETAKAKIAKKKGVPILTYEKVKELLAKEN